MKKVITSFAINDNFTDLLELSISRFYKYSITYNYDLYIPNYKTIINICNKFNWSINRPASWLKIPILKFLLKNYDIVQWIDSDVIINRFDKDITELFSQTDHIQSLVIHNDKHEGLVPNCGIWSVKKDFEKYLDIIWSKEEYINHVWWEQGANIDMLKDDEFLRSKCLSLPYEFNVHKNDTRYSQEYESNGIMLHATMYKNRKEKMMEWMTK